MHYWSSLQQCKFLGVEKQIEVKAALTRLACEEKKSPRYSENWNITNWNKIMTVLQTKNKVDWQSFLGMSTKTSLRPQVLNPTQFSKKLILTWMKSLWIERNLYLYGEETIVTDSLCYHPWHESISQFLLLLPQLSMCSPLQGWLSQS